MKKSIYILIVFCVLFAEASRSEEMIWQMPRGRLGRLGEYLKIEGQRPDGGKGGGSTLLVHKVNGKNLEQIIGIEITNVSHLPQGETIILQGYETGKMIGTPPGEREAAKERGEKLPPKQVAWQFAHYFVATSVISPKSIEIGEWKINQPALSSP